MDRFRLDEEVALVTGAGRGIGRAVAHALHEAGAAVWVADLDEESGRAAAEEVGGTFVALDVTDSAAVDAAVARVVAEAGALDVMVNNAGTVRNTPSTETTDDEWRAVMALNLDAVFYGCRAAARHMLPRGKGVIVNTGSMSGHIANRPQPQAAYNASKAAVIHLTRSLAAEWAPSGVRVNSVSPGYVGTEMTKAGMGNEEWRRAWLDATPMGRVGEPEEVGAVVVFLASPASSFLTGSDVVADGGYTAW